MNFFTDQYIKDMIKFAEEKHDKKVSIAGNKINWRDCITDLNDDVKIFWFDTEDRSTHAFMICSKTGKIVAS